RALMLDPECYLAAIGLHTLGIGWCDRTRSDGFIPVHAIPRIAIGNYAPVLAELLRVGFWEECDGGYAIHDYLDWQDSAEDIEARSASARNAAAQRWGNANCNADSNADSNASKPSPTVPEPNPTNQESV